MATYIIKKIDAEKGHITVVYSVDNVEQTMCDCPLDSEEATKAFLEDYGTRYEAAKAVEAANQVIDPKVQALVGKAQEIIKE